MNPQKIDPFPFGERPMGICWDYDRPLSICPNGLKDVIGVLGLKRRDFIVSKKSNFALCTDWYWKNTGGRHRHSSRKPVIGNDLGDLLYLLIEPLGQMECLHHAIAREAQKREQSLFNNRELFEAWTSTWGMTEPYSDEKHYSNDFVSITETKSGGESVMRLALKKGVIDQSVFDRSMMAIDRWNT